MGFLGKLVEGRGVWESSGCGLFCAERRVEATLMCARRLLGSGTPG